MRKTIVIAGSEIRDPDSFHTVFARALGFPGFYGRNLDAFHDCMRSAAVPDDGMMQEAVQPGGALRLVVDDAAGFRRRCPDQYAALVDTVETVNREYKAQGEPAPLILVFEPG